ncbi:MAG TPA: biotin--[acetyl-CoA-carboxylase] ligase [Candidatus Hungatella pullicola]|nr:biotin--[acetyl-CoA-carboxylase] ligase [Candidatus Hungatella pullicola]
MKTKVLKALKECDGYLSGQELCSQLGVSRAAVWKVIRQLEGEGYDIEAVRNRGYRLVGQKNAFGQAELECCLDGSFGKPVQYYPVVDSTNTRAKALAEEGASHGTLVVADCQESGKGRRGRSWTSPSGVNLYMSLILRPDILPSLASMVTLVAALAVRKGILETAGCETQIKWPNDLVSGGKKVCGILTEMSAELEGIHYIVVGIGINANIDAFPPEVAETATSIFLETGERISRSRLAAAVMKAFEEYYDQFIEAGSLKNLVDEYNEKMANKDRTVKVLDPAGEYQRVALGINEKGELLVKTDSGHIRRIVSGEVSVRGIYGYV